MKAILILLLLCGAAHAGEYVGGITGEAIDKDQCACVDRAVGNSWWKSTNASHCQYPLNACDGIAVSDYATGDDALFFTGGLGALNAGALVTTAPSGLTINTSTDLLEPSPANAAKLIAIAYNTTAATTDLVQVWLHPPMMFGPCCAPFAPNEITPSTIGSNQTDYDPAGIANADLINIAATGGTSMPRIDGIVSHGYDGRLLLVHNSGTSTFILRDNPTGSGNKFNFNGYDVPIFPDETVTLRLTGGKWIMIGTPPFIPPSHAGFYYRRNGFSNAGDTVTNCQDNAGTGATCTSDWTPIAEAGVGVQIRTGTTTTGAASLASGSAAALQPVFVMDNSYYRQEWYGELSQASDGTNRYTARIGFIDTTTGDSANGVYFRYTDNVNSGNWQGVCRSVSAESVVNSSIAGVSNIKKFVVVKGDVSASNYAEFFIDGTSIGSCPSNVPALTSGFGASIQKSLGTSNRYLLMFHMELIAYWGQPN